MVLDFNKPKKLRPTEEHNRMYRSEAIADGTYVPNMSLAAMKRWKAKKIGGSDPRVEIRKTVEGIDPSAKSYVGPYHGISGHCAAQMLAIVRKESVVMSANSRMVWSSKEWEELFQAVKEAREALEVK